MGLRHQLFRDLTIALADDLIAAGIDQNAVSPEVRLEQAGGYSISPHRWDLAIFSDDVPVALIEIKLTLSAARKNVWGRIDEIVAIAASTNRLFEGDASSYKPCIAILFLLEDSPSTRESRIHAALDRTSSDTPVTDKSKSLIEAVGEVFTRMVADQLVDSVCLLAVNSENGAVREPNADLSFESFVAGIRAYWAAVDRGRRANPQADPGAVGLGRALSRGAAVRGLVAGITSTAEGLSVAEAAVISSRRMLVAELQRLALDPDANETKLHAAIGSRYWLFGGQYVAVADRRNLVPMDQYDIPLICADGSLEIVELKGPSASLVKKYRNHYIVGSEVHEAVNQCLNYLRALDEHGAALRTHYHNELSMDLDLRRARGTVVIGHPGREFSSGATREQIEQTIRSYNAHLSRLTVLTYADLLDSAERSLKFAIEDAADARDA
ncbi:DUF4263 domain-containing protein [Pseudonocardia sp. DSM 110487]|uniref:Shedu anti-phage system protein SduA domain-containing protein n=1 Tax=Pseudonocardia sp. DSM 110487 TaxID=2865833 RepID=UPI001C6A59FD|nr:Shedu anti-phage system protein SduA domain-containing protein [Pseudonocardia sp. DSM 110487]QYN33002.1 DUF4263 domain-containing protein [Pseudonocardia sp. DSM 110487]